MPAEPTSLAKFCARQKAIHSRSKTTNPKHAEYHRGAVVAYDNMEKQIEAEESYEDRLLQQREEARGGEDHFKAQRDAALNLLRWLISDLIPSGSTTTTCSIQDGAEGTEDA